MVKLMITENEAGQRLDRFLRKYMRKASLGTIYKIIRKDAKLNGKRAKEDVMLENGDELALYISDEDLKKFTEIPRKKNVRKQFKIAYEDDNILIADKPRGLLTHGDAREKKNTLANQVCGYLQEKGEYEPAREKVFVPSPVNRLDRNTTGLVIFGKNAEALRAFTAYIRERGHVKKYYLTLVSGVLTDTRVIKGRLLKDTERNRASVILAAGAGEHSDFKVIGREFGKEAETIVRPLTHKGKYTLLEAELITGRTHQIRAHLAHEGYPLLGDSKYGDKHINEKIKASLGIVSQLLHAYRLEFSGMEGSFEYLEGRKVTAEPPDDFKRVLNTLGFDTDYLETFEK